MQSSVDAGLAGGWLEGSLGQNTLDKAHWAGWELPMCRCHLDRETGMFCNPRHANLPPLPVEQGQGVAWGTCFL